jgi:hypothetical protein
MDAPGQESNGAFRAVWARMDLSTARKAGANTLKSKSTGNFSASMLSAAFGAAPPRVSAAFVAWHVRRPRGVGASRRHAEIEIRPHVADAVGLTDV